MGKLKTLLFALCATALLLPGIAAARGHTGAHTTGTHATRHHGHSSGRGPYYGGGHHTASHGGHYAGGQGSSHKGGKYVNPRTSNHYGHHKTP
jgi:hypothetical protein